MADLSWPAWLLCHRHPRDGADGLLARHNQGESRTTELVNLTGAEGFIRPRACCRRERDPVRGGLHSLLTPAQPATTQASVRALSDFTWATAGPAERGPPSVPAQGRMLPGLDGTMARPDGISVGVRTDVFSRKLDIGGPWDSAGLQGHYYFVGPMDVSIVGQSVRRSLED